ncbi:chaperone protein ClpB-like isoform X1 [Ruditapes philippinarum]|uniref:chaperone protein ClpB-like isoform X1 n=1 Tax=Ruditapes philippinarum TaxID=129788 RepID=UPI00295C23F5|nr:chaperone protein ClpB-like isoform X1 [Ruditapes philippinarum]
MADGAAGNGSDDCPDDNTERIAKAVCEMLQPKLDYLSNRLDVLSYDRDNLMKQIQDKEGEIERKKRELLQVKAEREKIESSKEMALRKKERRIEELENELKALRGELSEIQTKLQLKENQLVAERRKREKEDDSIKYLEKELESATNAKVDAHKQLNRAKVAYQQRKSKINIEEYKRKNLK